MGVIDRVLSRLGGRPRWEDGLARSKELAKQGRAWEAFRLLRREARQTESTEMLDCLAKLRRPAAAELAKTTSPRVDWPPRLPDPFPARPGIPEIDRTKLNADVMGGAILHHGSILVRGLLDRAEATSFADQIDGLFAEYDDWAAGYHRDGSLLVPFEMLGTDAIAGTRLWNRKTGGVFAADCPNMLERVIRLYERHGLIAAIEGYLGERPVVSVGKTVLRRVDPTNAGDFHQDGAFLGRDIRTVNVWIALSDCGVDAPGLEVVDRRLPGIVETGTGDSAFDWSVGRGVAKAANEGRPFARPEFKAGDALIFDQLMLHATSYSQEMNRQRFALECWFFAPSASAIDQIPLAI